MLKDITCPRPLAYLLKIFKLVVTSPLSSLADVIAAYSNYQDMSGHKVSY